MTKASGKLPDALKQNIVAFFSLTLAGPVFIRPDSKTDNQAYYAVFFILMPSLKKSNNNRFFNLLDFSVYLNGLLIRLYRGKIYK